MSFGRVLTASSQASGQGTFRRALWAALRARKKARKAGFFARYNTGSSATTPPNDSLNWEFE